MARPRKSGVNVARYRRRDGTVVEYYYDRRTNKPLGNDRSAAEEQASKLEDAVREPEDQNTVAWLIARYLGRPAFSTKAPKTQKLYRGYLNEMRDRWGDLPYRDFGPQAIERIKESFASQPRKANQIIALFRLILGYAVKLQKIKVNPALRPEMLPTPPRTQVWSYAEEDAFLKHAKSPRLKLAILLLMYTAQRVSDVLAMTKNNVTERNGRLWILVRQAKTQELVAMPLHKRLEPLTRERLADTTGGLLLVPSPTGKPWHLRNFARSWDAVAKDSGIKDRQRRDLRRTAVVRMAQAGLAVPRIASITGWGIDYCQRIVDTYLPRRSEVAASAIEQWENAEPADPNVVDLGIHRGRK